MHTADKFISELAEALNSKINKLVVDLAKYKANPDDPTLDKIFKVEKPDYWTGYLTALLGVQRILREEIDPHH